MCLCLLHNSSLDELEELTKSYCLGLPNKVSEILSCKESKKIKFADMQPPSGSLNSADFFCDTY